jgi:hypothetical protein
MQRNARGGSHGLWAAIALSALLVAACADDSTSTVSVTEPSSLGSTATTEPPITAPADSTSVGGPRGNGPIAIDDDGSTHVQHDRMQDGLEALPLAELTDAEVAGMLHVSEAQRLAHEVIGVFASTWDLPVFANVATSEATHMDAMMLLLRRYGIADPAIGAAPGTFDDEALQQLYDGSVAQGLESEEGALTASAAIEELDIVELRALATDAPDVMLVYSSLEQASRNHLRVFAADLATMGVTYLPGFLSSAEYDAIVSSPIETNSEG